MTPGRNCSTMTSARFTKGCSWARSSTFFRSRATLRLPRLRSPKPTLSCPHLGARPRISSPRGGSILTTSAPASANSSVASGPGSRVEKSRTNRPSRGLIALSLFWREGRYLSCRSIRFGRAGGKPAPRRASRFTAPVFRNAGHTTGLDRADRKSDCSDGEGMSKDNVTVGFVGLGTMGGRMAANVQRAGFKLIVHDLHRQAASHHLADGAVWAGGPAALARQADVIFSSLPEPSDVEAVALGPDGLIAGIKPGAAYFDLSTNSPSVVKKLSAAFAERGAHMLDAPVSGGPAGAASRKLAIWVGGDENVFNRHKAVLDAIGDKAAYIGPIGSATVAKLVHNMSGYAIVCALAETFTLGVKAGVEPLALWQAVRQGAAGRRFTFDALIDQFLPGKYDPPAFALKLAHKDVSLANALGRDLGVPMRMCNLTLAEMTEALARGWGGRDSRSVMLLQQERAGVKIAVDPERLREALAPAVSKDGAKPA